MNGRNGNARRSAAPGPGAARPAAKRTATRARRPAAPSGGAAALDRRYAAMKWALLAALLVYAVLVVRANSARDVDFSAIAERIASAPGIGELNAEGENAFQDRLGASPEGCEGWLLYDSDEVMNVSELMIAKSPDGATLDRLEAAARAHIDAQLDVFRSYGVNQKALLESAALWQRGDYLFYAVGEDAGAWEEAFLSCIR